VWFRVVKELRALTGFGTLSGLFKLSLSGNNLFVVRMMLFAVRTMLFVKKSML
jgi:hypothetical protein